MGILLNFGLQNQNLYDTSIPYLWSLGFGTVTSQELITLFSFHGPSGLILTILIANSPQILLSFIYLTYNGLFTCMLLAEEWSGFAKERKKLRVTTAKSGQHSTYWLQLPYRYGMPLLIISGTLHWLVSQSFFLARVNVINADGTPDTSDDISVLGYSNISIIFTIGLGCIVVVIGLAHGFRKYSSGMPVAGSCSAAISAACHPPDGDTKASSKPILWGVVGSGGIRDYEGRPIRHCSFTSFEVESPEEGELYA